MSAAPSVLWQKNPALAWREIDDETIIISPSESVMHELNDTGSFIWKNIDGERTTAALAALLAETYEVTLEAATADIEALLQQLSSRKLVVPAGTAAIGALR
jgi:Coenzyme PQQ synthesis protein D (PqqD)